MNSANYARLVFVLGSSLLACDKAPDNSQVMFVDEHDVSRGGDLTNWRGNPLILVVEINTEGRLKLNRIETESVNDTTILAERLKTVFKDRESSSISEREVLVEMYGDVKPDDLEKVIEMLEGVGASPIRVFRSAGFVERKSDGRSDRREQSSPFVDDKEVQDDQVQQKE